MGNGIFRFTSGRNNTPIASDSNICISSEISLQEIFGKAF